VTHREVHLNLTQSSQQLFELDPGAVVEAGNGWIVGAGTPPHPVISNAAFRTDDEVDPAELLARARAFFGKRGRGFSVWARAGIDGDRDLIATAEAEGLQSVYEMPEMILDRWPQERPLGEGVELRRVASAAEASEYWRVAALAYSSLGFPEETFGSYTNHAGLLADNVAAFLAYRDGEPVSIAMTIVSHGVAGIYWVGSVAEARGRGLGWTVTAAAVNAGFDLGAEIASLQASPMGESLYAAMGFETVFTYRLLMTPASETSAGAES
jgi:GNAT acetyltransferase-like protein